MPTVPEERVNWRNIVRVYNPLLLLENEPDEYLSAFLLLEGCLTLDHSKRLTASDARQHRFLTTSMPREKITRKESIVSGPGVIPL